MSSFEDFSSVSYQAEDFQYSPSIERTHANVALVKKRVRVIRGGKPAILDGRKIDKANESTSLQMEFRRLCSVWKKETQALSSLTEAAMHPAYQRIIGLGPAVMPLLIAELEQNPDWWFWALRAITGADPVKDEERGRLAAMKTAWLLWWESEGVAGRWKV